MEYFRKYFIIIILIVAIGIVWAGTLVFSKDTFTNINANAERYVAPLSSNFDSETLSTVSERIEAGFAIQPKSFFEMEDIEKD